MPLLIEISDDTLDALRVPRADAEEQLRTELALILYARGALSHGKAVEMTRSSHWAFEDLLQRRGTAMPFTEEDLAQDLAWVAPA